MGGERGWKMKPGQKISTKVSTTQKSDGLFQNISETTAKSDVLHKISAKICFLSEIHRNKIKPIFEIQCICYEIANFLHVIRILSEDAL